MDERDPFPALTKAAHEIAEQRDDRADLALELPATADRDCHGLTADDRAELMEHAGELRAWRAFRTDHGPAN